MARDEREATVGYIDTLIGDRIRTRRLSLGMDEEMLGRAVGLTAEQIQDHEGGNTRVRASRLAAIAEALDVPIVFFFPNPEPNAI